MATELAKHASDIVAGRGSRSSHNTKPVGESLQLEAITILKSTSRVNRDKRLVLGFLEMVLAESDEWTTLKNDSRCDIDVNQYSVPAGTD